MNEKKTMKNCADIRQTLAEVAMGQKARTDAIEQHLAQCPACKQYQDDLKTQGEQLTRFHDWIDQDMPARQERVLAALDSGAHPSSMSRTHHMPRFWFRLGLAAGLLLFIGLLIHQLGGSVDPARVSFAQVKQAINQVPWIHIVMKGEHRTHSDLCEVWAGFRAGVLASREVNGNIDFTDLRNGKEHQYDADASCIWVLPVRYDLFVYDLDSPHVFLQSILRSYADQGATLSKTVGDFEGRQVYVFKAEQDYTYGHCNLHVFVDMDTYLPCAARETWQSGEQPAQTIEIEVTYPADGPSNIYDLQIPKTLKQIHTTHEQKTL